VLKRLNFEGWVYQARYSASGDNIGVIIGVDMFYQVTENDRIAIPLPPNVTRFAWRGEQNTVAAKDKMVLAGERADFSLPVQSGFRRMTASMVVNTAAAIGTISRLAWSPDGTKLAYVKDDKLELVTQDSLFSISLKGVTITDLAWHPGLSGVGLTSNFLATLTDDLEILIWDVASLSIVSSENLANPGLALSWSPDGKSLALVNVAGELIVYDYDQQLVQEYRQQFANDYIRTVSWSPNGRQLALGSDDNSIVVFDWRNKQIVERLSLHTDWVRKVIWLDDDHFASSGDDGQTLIWGNRNREGKFKQLHTLDELAGFHVSLAYHATKSGGILAVGTTDNQLGRWLLDPAFTPTFDTLLVLPTAVTDLAWRPKSEDLVFSSYSSVPQELDRYLQLQAAYGSNEKPVVISDLDQILMNQKGGLASYFYLPKIRVTPNRYDQVAWSKDEQYLAYIDAESTPASYNQLQLHDLAQQELTLTYGLGDANIAYLTISPDKRYLAVAPDSGYFMILNLNDPADSLRWPLGEADLKNWEWSADGRSLALLDRNYQVFVYDTQKRTLDRFATEIKDYDQATILFHPRRKQRLYIVNHQGIYELNTDKTAAAQLIYAAPSATHSNLPDDMVRATWIDDGQQLLYVKQGMPSTLLAVEPGATEVLHQTGEAENFFAWTGTPPGRLAETRPMDQDETDFNGQDLEYARIWNLAAGEPLAILRGVRSQLVTEMALSSDGRQLATLGAALEPYQGKYNRGPLSVRIWEVESQRNIFDLTLAGTQNLSFSPQGNYLLTYFNNGQVGIWPLETSTISRYLANSDKDLYLERLSSKDNQPFLDRIEEWELGKGINFKEENFDLIKAREGTQIRRNWGEYYVDRAWLDQEEEAVAQGFEQARSLHYVENTTRIRPSTMDTLALVNIWIERTYFALASKDDQQADEALLEAQRLRPGLKRLAMLDLLLAWQEGRREGLVQALLNGEVLTIQEEYANWDRRDIHLNDEIFYLRLVALIQSRPDLVSPISEPLMATLLADLDPLTREKLLIEYYRINASNPNLIELGMRQTYFENAVAFLETNWAATQADSERLQDYISYNYYLQDLELQKKKPQRASRNAANNLKAAESLLAMNPDNPDYETLYLATLAEAAMLDLRVDRTKASEVTQRLRSARQRHPDVEAPYLELQLANAQLLMDDKKAAFQDYYSLLERYGLSGTENLLKEELDAIDPAITATVKPVLEAYRIYRQARGAYWEEKPVFTLASLKTEAPDLTTADWEGYAQTTKGLFDATVMLNKTDMLPKDSLRQHMEEYNRSVGDRIYLLLYSGNWELVAPSLEEFRQDLPQQKWPVAVDAVLAVLEGDWSVARRLLNQVKDLPNDGIRTEEFTQMRDFLLSLPRAVRENKAFLKRWDNWQSRLE
jgi:WD40 repeat protein